MENVQGAGYRMVWMKNTLHMRSFYISEALIEEARKNPDITIVGEAAPIPFKENGNVPWLGDAVKPFGVHENL